MSLINGLTDIIVQPTESKRHAQDLIRMTRDTYDSMVRTFNEGALLFWNNDSEAINTELGIQASGLFYLHARLGETIALIDPSSIAQGLSVVGVFTQNEDGTITLE